MSGAKSCPCCGALKRQVEGSAHYYHNCDCYFFNTCDKCGRCYDHCHCISLEDRLDQLIEEEKKMNRLVDEANTLAIKLGIEGISGPYSVSDLIDIEARLKQQYLSVKRLRRRLDKLEEAYSQRDWAERALAKRAQELETDRIH